MGYLDEKYVKIDGKKCAMLIQENEDDVRIVTFPACSIGDYFMIASWIIGLGYNAL